MRKLSPQPAHAKHVAFAVGLSCALHAAVGVALLHRAPKTVHDETTPSRALAGGTFDVEAFQDSAGSPSENASPPSPALPKAVPPGRPPRDEPPQQPEPKPLQPEPSPHEKPSASPTPEAPTPKADDERAPDQIDSSHPPAENSPSTPASAAAAPRDPFDLKLPGTSAGESATPSAPPSDQKTGGSYGAEGDPSAVVDLHAAFLKTLPLAAKSDPTWTQLAPGAAGSITIELSVDDSLKLGPIRVLDTPAQPAPAHLKRMVLKNRGWLHTQRFSIGQQETTGTQRLRIQAIISQKPADPDTPDAAGTQALGTRGGQNPTGSYFTYFSGRHVELTVTRVPHK